MPPIIPLKSINRDHLETVGQKVFEISRLETYDFRVPDGFCITSDVYARYMAPYLGHVRKIDHQAKRTQVLRAAEDLRAVIGELALAPDTLAAVKMAIRDFNGESKLMARPCVFYRGTGEFVYTDKYHAYFDLTEQNVEEIVIKCWQGLFSEEAVMHKRKINIENEDIEIAILVQQVVEGNVAGSLHTSDPRDNDNGVFFVQAGYANKHATLFKDAYAEEYVVDKEDFAIAKLQEDGQLSRLIDDEQVVKIAKMGLEIEEIFGVCKRVEWVTDKEGRIWIVQSESVANWYPAKVESLADRKTQKRIYAYLGRVFGTEDILCDATKSMLDRISPVPIHYFGSRPYVEIQDIVLNTGRLGQMVLDIIEAMDYQTAERINTILDLPDEEGLKRRSKMANLGKVAKYTALDAKFKLGTRNATLAETVDNALGKAEFFMRELEETLDVSPNLQNKLTALEDGLLRSFKMVFKDLFSLLGVGIKSLSQLRDMSETSLTPEHDAMRMAGSGSLGTIDKIMEELQQVFDIFAAKDKAETDKIIFDRNEEGNIFSYKSFWTDMENITTLCGKETAEAFSLFFKKYGHWGIDQLDIKNRTWNDDATILFEALRESSQENKEQNENILVEAEGMLASFFGNKGEKLVCNVRLTLPIVGMINKVFARLIQLTKEIVDEVGLALEAEKKLMDRKDVTYLRIEEMMAALNSNESVIAILLARKKEEKLAIGLVPPRTMLTDGIVPEALHRTIEDDTIGQNWQLLQGKGVSPGTVEGVARVIKTMTRIRLSPGEILVVPSMNLGWTPLMVQAAGVISDCGGQGSVGTVFCAKRGIPAIVGVRGCTQSINTGDVIRIDGITGNVVKLYIE